MFNALKYTKNLEAVGFRREQAEAQVQLILDAIEDNVATKSDITEIRSDIIEIRSDITEIRSDIIEIRSDITEIRSDITEIRSEIAVLKSQFSVFETKIIFKLGTLMVVCMTLATTVLGFLIKFH